MRVDELLLEAWCADDDALRLVDVNNLKTLHAAAPRDQAAEVVVRGCDAAEPEQPQSAQAGDPAGHPEPPVVEVEGGERGAPVDGGGQMGRRRPTPMICSPWAAGALYL